ncbi:tyrosine-type recombinase/integrase [Vibrio sp. WJH972]
MRYKLAYKPTYIIQVGDVFYFSMRIPTTRKLFRKSLRTKDSYQAQNIVRRVKEKIEGVRVSAEILKLLIDDEVERLINVATAMLLPRSEQGREAIQLHQKVTEESEYYNLNVTDSHVGEPSYTRKIPTLKEFLLDKVNTKHQVPQLSEDDLSFDPVYAQSNAECDLLNTYAEKLKKCLQNDDFNQAFNALSALKQSFNIDHLPQAQIESKTPLFEEALNQYIEDKDGMLYKDAKGKSIASKASNEQIRHLEDFFLHLFKGKHIDLITSNDIDDAFYLLTQYPQRKYSPYKKMSIEECIKAAHEQSVPDDRKTSSGLIRGKTAISKMFQYFYKRHIINSNPVENMRFDNFKEGKSKGAYSCDDIKKLTKYCTCKPLDNFTSSIMIMAYGGLRNGEIVKLTQDSIRQLDGIYYFEVDGTKTDNAFRYVPIHQKLLDIGILDYFKNKTEFISSQQLTNWFTRRTEKLGLPAFSDRGELLTFYSLRHSFMTALATHNISSLHIEQLVGHAHQGTKARYIDKISIKVLNDSLQKLSYDYQ